MDKLPIKFRINLLLIRTWKRFDMWRKGYKKDELMSYLIDNNTDKQ
jgi:hypothetical protein